MATSATRPAPWPKRQSTQKHLRIQLYTIPCGSLDLGFGRTNGMSDAAYDVIVVGAGNAAMCAALSAAETGASVLVLERAPEAEHGGNSTFTAGAMRFAYSGVADLRKVMPDLPEEEVERTDFGTYTESSSSTIWAESPSIGPIPTLRNCW